MSVRIVGVGNRFRGDDGVGPWVIAALRERLPRASLGVSDGNMSRLLDEFGHCQNLLLIDALDAAAAGLAVGTVVRLDGRDPGLEAAGLHASTHAMGLAEAIARARVLDCVPGELTVIGIAGEHFDHGEALSAPGSEAATALVAELAGELSRQEP